MTTIHKDTRSPIERSVFAGLAPEPLPETGATAPNALTSTMPILLVSTMAMSMNLIPGAVSGAAEAAAQPPTKPGTNGDLQLASTSSGARTATLPAPATYTVVKGDTISGIAARYGLKTADVLALNGLKATSLIFPGQVIKLTTAASTPAPSTPIATAPSGTATTYTIVKGDTVSKIAAKHGVSTQSVLTANGLGWSSIIYPGQKLTIPGTAPVSTPPVDAEPVSNVTPTPEAETPAPPAETPAPAPETPAPATPVNGSYVIQSGDTVTKIANKFGVTVQAILDANGLTRTSIIYAGRTLVIPGVATATTPAGATNITLLQDDQLANARIIVQVGRELGVSDYGIIIALSAAMQESSLRNINYGHLDSVGLFQQRPSAGWGTIAQLTDPAHAARLFYGGPSNPNKGKTRGLLDIAGWQNMTVTQAAQKVQISAYPDAYAKWEASARFWLSEL
jgi:LysM repeat protein